MITLKIPYITEQQNIEFIQDLQRQYSTCLKVTWKYLKKGLSKKEIKEKLLTYNNVESITNNSWFMASLFYDVKSLLQFDKICFKAKYLFKRDKDNLSKEEWKTLKNLPLCSIGDGLNHANRFFRFTNQSTLIFKPNKSVKIQLNLKNIGYNRLLIIRKLIHIQENNLAPISYKLDHQYVYISFDETLIEKKEYKSIENRIFAIDLNPNYIGYSILDWKDTEKLEFNIVKTGVIDFKEINDKHFSYNKQRNIASTDKRRIHLNNKREHEIFQASKFLINQAKHYKCEMFAMEDLIMKSKDSGKGKNYNAFCNNLWYRNKLVNNLTKRCNQQGITLLKVQAQYSSILGNLIYRNLNLPDMILSSIEISRRCQEFNLQYIKKSKDKKKNVIYPELNSKITSLLHQSMEELGVKDESYDLGELQSIFKFLKKNHEIKYRVPLPLGKSCKSNQLRFKKHFYTCFNKF